MPRRSARIVVLRRNDPIQEEIATYTAGPLRIYNIAPAQAWGDEPPQQEQQKRQQLEAASPATSSGHATASGSSAKKAAAVMHSCLFQGVGISKHFVCRHG